MFSVEKKKKKNKEKKIVSSITALSPYPSSLIFLILSPYNLIFCTYCILLCGLIGRIWPAAMWWDVKIIIYLSIMLLLIGRENPNAQASVYVIVDWKGKSKRSGFRLRNKMAWNDQRSLESGSKSLLNKFEF